MKRPRLNVLRTFESAGRHFSFSRAGEELGITQAAVSQQIRQLEAYLKAPLFIRRHVRLSLTNVGSAYFDAVHEAIDRLDTVTDQLFPDQQDQIVTLRCTSSVAALWLAPRLGKFRKRHPGIDLRIMTPDPDHDGGNINGAELEIVVVAKGTSNPHSQKLFTATITPVCSPGLLPGNSRLRKACDVIGFELIHVLGYEDDWHRWFRKFELDDVDVPRGLSVDGSLVAIEAALRGDGIFLGRRPFIDAHLQSGRLVEAFTRPYHLHADYCLVQQKQTRRQRASVQVKNWLAELALQEY